VVFAIPYRMASACNLSCPHSSSASLSLSPKGEGFTDPLSGTLKNY
jgi:hypothetical protein